MSGMVTIDLGSKMSTEHMFQKVSPRDESVSSSTDLNWEHIIRNRMVKTLIKYYQHNSIY
jgi:hypothetical protein